MARTDLSIAGTCRCGATRFALAADPVRTAACHYRGCQRMTGSAFSPRAMAPAEAIAVTQGAPVIGGLHGPEQHHHFCPDCLSWMFTRIEGLPFANVRSALLDDPACTRPFIETMTAEKRDWATTPAAHAFAGFPPPPDEYGPLMAAFAGR